MFQEVMWGPAPAITPSANKSSVPSSGNTVASNASAGGGTGASANNNGEEASQAKGGKGGKKKKNKKLVDSSLLGFTVQADPERIKSGEIETVD